MTVSRRLFLATGSAGLAMATHNPSQAFTSLREADVVVIGAGLSGLVAARTLEAAGARVVLIEGTNRIGGRLYTLDDLPGQPDAGGIQIGSNYNRLISLASTLGVTLQPGGEFDRTALYNIRSESLTGEQWPASSVNHLVGPERNMPPAALGSLYARRIGGLPDPDAWRTEAGARLDIAYSTALKAAGASDEAIRLIAANLDRNGMEGYSALNGARSAAFYASAGPNAALSVIKGGSQRLPEAMASALATAPRLGQRVTGIEESRRSVRVHIDGHSSITARHVICTIPFSVLRGIHLDGPSVAPMQTAITALPYSHASFAYLSAIEPFWNHDGLPRMMWSDDPLIGRVFVLGDDPAMLKVWLSGSDADAIDRMAPSEAGAAIITRLEAARPSAKGKLRLERLFSWQNEAMAKGAYHYIGTGQATMLSRAVVTTGHRLHFAGEHLAQSTTGMEGALESGTRSAETVIAQL